jgi:hypothetical protein
LSVFYFCLPILSVRRCFFLWRLLPLHH